MRLPAEVVSARSKSGRRWAVRYLSETMVVLDPVGYDVQSARSARTGRWQGGVRSLIRPITDVADATKWTPVDGD